MRLLTMRLITSCRASSNVSKSKKSKKDINRSNRIGKPSSRKKRPIILKFVWFYDAYKAYLNKKRVKDSRISITQSLTAYRIGRFKKARGDHGFQILSTQDDEILFKENDLISYNCLKSYHQGNAPLIFVKIKTYSIDTLNFYQTLYFRS